MAKNKLYCENKKSLLHLLQKNNCFAKIPGVELFLELKKKPYCENKKAGFICCQKARQMHLHCHGFGINLVKWKVEAYFRCCQKNNKNRQTRTKAFNGQKWESCSRKLNWWFHSNKTKKER